MTETTSQLDQRADDATDESDDELIAKYIIRNPDGRGPDRAVTTHGVSVWLLVEQVRASGGNIHEIAADHDLPEVAVRAALAYYRQNQALIDARILINNAYWNEA